MRGRGALSVALALHLTLVASTFVPVPDPLGGAAHRYTRLLGLHQNWRLFAPAAIRWHGDLEITAYFPLPGDSPGDPAHPDGSSPGQALADGTGWSARTYHLLSGPETLLPRHRTHRGIGLAFRMSEFEGYEPYRLVLANEACDAVEAEAGVRPSGLTITGLWGEVGVPWERRAPVPAEREPLGGFEC